MRVLALGGAGGMGRHACKIAACLDQVDDLVVTDLDAGRAAAFAAGIGPRARACGLDVTGEKALTAALRDADVVINTVGPFFRFGVPVLRAAIAAGCHYLDICDDWEPTLDMLAMHADAQDAGVTAVIGIGASPGISNLLAVMAARELDQTDTIVTGWNIEAAQPDEDSGPAMSAALVHGVRQMTGTIRVARDHQQLDEPPLKRTTIDYPGLGRRPAWTFGHPEPLTLTSTFPRVKTSVNVTYAASGLIAAMKALRWTVDHDIISAERAVAAINWAEHHMPPAKASKFFHPRRLPPLFAHAAGTSRGEPATVAAALCRPPGATMAALTGTPLAVALGMLCDGEITSPGVHPPEAIIDPGRFFAALARHCPGHPDPAEMVSVIRSWDTGPRARYQSDILAARRYASALPLTPITVKQDRLRSRPVTGRPYSASPAPELARYDRFQAERGRDPAPATPPAPPGTALGVLSAGMAIASVQITITRARTMSQIRVRLAVSHLVSIIGRESPGWSGPCGWSRPIAQRETGAWTVGAGVSVPSCCHGGGQGAGDGCGRVGRGGVSRPCRRGGSRADR